MNYAGNVAAVLANILPTLDFPAPVNNIIHGIAGITVTSNLKDINLDKVSLLFIFTI